MSSCSILQINIDNRVATHPGLSGMSWISDPLLTASPMNPMRDANALDFTRQFTFQQVKNICSTVLLCISVNLDDLCDKLSMHKEAQRTTAKSSKPCQSELSIGTVSYWLWSHTACSLSCSFACIVTAWFPRENILSIEWHGKIIGTEWVYNLWNQKCRCSTISHKIARYCYVNNLLTYIDRHTYRL